MFWRCSIVDTIYQPLYHGSTVFMEEVGRIMNENHRPSGREKR
ncbi:MAG: hypothetical protein [Olavius algarvensis Delta 4 endosymbiont]|nr:MAG: hypothetical protein [Olavius algarvensis Delta 4 endosymbiont]